MNGFGEQDIYNISIVYSRISIITILLLDVHTIFSKNCAELYIIVYNHMSYYAIVHLIGTLYMGFLAMVDPQAYWIYWLFKSLKVV